MEESYYSEPDPNSEAEQFRRRDLAPVRRLELRESFRGSSRRYAIGVGVVAAIVFVIYWLS